MNEGLFDEFMKYIWVNMIMENIVKNISFVCEMILEK
jgi:hypothetical protein